MSFRISLLTSPSAWALGGADALSFAIQRAREAEAAGVDDIWLNQGIDLDGISHPVGLALVGDEEPSRPDSAGTSTRERDHRPRSRPVGPDRGLPWRRDDVSRLPGSRFL